LSPPSSAVDDHILNSWHAAPPRGYVWALVPLDALPPGVVQLSASTYADPGVLALHAAGAARGAPAIMSGGSSGLGTPSSATGNAAIKMDPAAALLALGHDGPVDKRDSTTASAFLTWVRDAYNPSGQQFRMLVEALADKVGAFLLFRPKT
jgi:hypothetical protein